MGLLDRASRHKDDGDFSPEEPGAVEQKAGRGLFARASAFRESLKSQSPPDLSTSGAPPSGSGLLKKAEFFRHMATSGDTIRSGGPEIAPMGLLAKAQKFRDIFQAPAEEPASGVLPQQRTDSVTRAADESARRGLLARAISMRSQEENQVPPVPDASSAGTGGGLLSRASQMADEPEIVSPSDLSDTGEDLSPESGFAAEEETVLEEPSFDEGFAGFDGEAGEEESVGELEPDVSSESDFVSADEGSDLEEPSVDDSFAGFDGEAGEDEIAGELEQDLSPEPAFAAEEEPVLEEPSFDNSFAGMEGETGEDEIAGELEQDLSPEPAFAAEEEPILEEPSLDEGFAGMEGETGEDEIAGELEPDDSSESDFATDEEPVVETGEKKGLLARAEELQEDFVPESDDLLIPEDLNLEGESAQEAQEGDTESPLEDSLELDDAAGDEPGGDPFFDELEGEADQDLLSDEPEGGEGDLPALSYSGQSDHDDDPLKDGHLSRHDDLSELSMIPADESEDPFDVWEREAEELAESAIEETVAGETGEDDFIFSDDEDKYLTRYSDETHQNQSRIDSYRSLFEISRELSALEDIEELWEAAIFSIMGQLGAGKLCVFSSNNAMEEGEMYYPMAWAGLEPSSEWSLKPGDEIYDRLTKKPGMLQSRQLEEMALSSQENEILGELEAEIVMTIRHGNRNLGILVVSGDMNRSDGYSADDLEFLNLLMDLTGVSAIRILSRISIERKTDELREKDRVHKEIFLFTRKSAAASGVDEIYDLLQPVLKQGLGVRSYSLSLFSPEDRCYRVFAGNGISPDSMDRFCPSTDSEFIATISHITRVYDFKNYKTHPDIVSGYTNDDLAMMRFYHVVPLINLGWLVGFLSIYDTEESWTEPGRELAVSAAEVMAPVFANSIILKERESVFRDPFSPFEDRLKRELEKSLQFQASVSVVELKIQNLKRLFAMNPADQVVSFLLELGELISAHLHEKDYFTRTGQGSYAMILPGRNRKEAERFMDRLRESFGDLNSLKDSPLDISYGETIVTAPDDAMDSERLIALLG